MMARNTNIEPDIERRHFLQIRALVDVLGPDNVMAGSDWPVAGERPVRDLLIGTMQRANLSDDEQNAIAIGNSRRLLGIG